MVFKSDASTRAMDLDAAEAVVMETKLEALIAHFTRVKGEDPTAKCLVFTQFKHTMDWLCTALPARGFQFRTLAGDMSQVGATV